MNSNTELPALVFITALFTTSASQRLNLQTCMDLPVEILISSPHQCDKFYRCGNGLLSEEATCPRGALFNPDKQICDFPQNVDCREVPLPSWIENSEPNDPNKCPVEDPEYPVFLPVLNDCGSYYFCYHGKKILMSCPHNLHWSAEVTRCENPANAKCESVDEMFRCPQEGIDFLPHPYDCRRFIYCRHGFARLQSCSFLSVFDKKQKTCVFDITC